MRPVRIALWTAAAVGLVSAVIAVSGSDVRVEIAAGQPAVEIARYLRAKGVIASPRAFRALAGATGLDRDLKPGVYRLRRHMLSAQALWRLTRGKPESVKITIPEGFNARQIGERLEANGIVPARVFEEYARANHLEGYLFPSTYYLSRDMSAEDAAHRMHVEFTQIAQPEISRADPHRLSPDQIVTLASIVEREGGRPEEKPMIAAVYLNRLARRQPLAADPTVQYALGYWKKGLTHGDLELDSPYNTYVHYGLPPGPICSPGLDSIRAVLRPAETNALFFVADNSGGHVFSATFEDHLKAKLKAKHERLLMRRQAGQQ